MQANQRKQYQTNLQTHAKYEISIKFAQQIRGNIVQINTIVERKETVSSKNK